MREPQSDHSDPEIRRIVDADWIASDGLLRTDEQLIRGIFETLPFERMGDRSRKRLMTVAQDIRRRRGRG
jgi:hypothetical protein